MQQIFAAAEMITSNRVYSVVMERLVKQLKCENALLLVPASLDHTDLIVVEAVGMLPAALNLTGIKERLDTFPSIVFAMDASEQPLTPYGHFIRFSDNGCEPSAYLLFSGPIPRITPRLESFLGNTSRLFHAKQSIDSLETMRRNQAKLTYQLNFMGSVINNIFEPYGNDYLLQLYLEIVSEMFAFPEAVVLKLEQGHFKPIISKGVKINDISHFVLDAEPLLKNSNLSFYPTIIKNCLPENIGQANYNMLIQHGARVIFPLQYQNRLDCLMICFAIDDQGIGSPQDSLTLNALGTILNKAREMNLIKENLLQSNRTLDQKLFALSAVYRAAELIFSSTDMKATMQMTLDMLMEIFQSGTSSIFLYEQRENRLEMMRLKSAFTQEDQVYWLHAPRQLPKKDNSIVQYKYNDEQRETFLRDFPGFAGIADTLDPVLILHLTKPGLYFGFVTLSERVTGQTYGPDDIELLSLLINSVTVAVENVLVYEQLLDKNEQLELSLANIFAIQDVLRIIREARNLESFIKLLSAALSLGVRVADMQILSRGSNGMVSLLKEGPPLLPEMTAAVERITDNELITFVDQRQALVFPIKQYDWVAGYIIVWSFADTILVDGERIKLLSIIASIIEEPFARLLERESVVSQGIMDISKLALYRLEQEVNRLEDLGLEPAVIKIDVDAPGRIIAGCQEWAEGFVYLPHTGVMVTYLSQEEAEVKLAELGVTPRFLTEISAEALYGPQ